MSRSLPKIRQDGGGEAAKLVPFARTQPHRNDQTNKSAQTKRLIRRSLRFRPLALGVTTSGAPATIKAGKVRNFRKTTSVIRWQPRADLPVPVS